MPPASKRRMVTIDPSRLTTIRRTTANQQHPNQSSNDGCLWADKLSPSYPSELAVHPKKLALIHAWLNDALHGPAHTRKYRRLLILAGPAGSGKSTIIHSLSHQRSDQLQTVSSTTTPATIQPIGYEILEWRNTGNESSVPKPQEFSLWLMRASAGPTLSFNDDDPSSSSTSQSKRPTVLLVDDLPNLYHGETGRIFANAMRQHLSSGRPCTPPMVVIITDTSVTAGSNGFDDSVAGRSAFSNSAEERGTNVHTLIPPDIRQNPATFLLKLRPVNATLMKKMLARIANSFNAPSHKLTPKDLDSVILASAGDIRAALNNLQLFFSSHPPASIFTSATRSRNKLPASSSSSLFTRQLLSFRDESLVIFHSLGKILYNKRWGDDAKEDTKDTRTRAPKPDPLPAFWAEYNRRVMKTDMDVIEIICGVECVGRPICRLSPPELSRVHGHDRGGYISTGVSEPFGRDDDGERSSPGGLIGRRERGLQYSQATTMGFYQFHIAARGMLLGLPSPVTRRNQKLLKPALWGNLRLMNENAGLVHDARSQQGLLGSPLDPPSKFLSHQGRLLLHLELSYEALGSRGSALSQPDLCTGWRVQRSQLSPVYLFPYLVQPKNEEDPVEVLDRFSTFFHPSTANVHGSQQLSEDAVPSSDSDPEPDRPTAPLPARVAGPSNSLLSASFSSSSAPAPPWGHHHPSLDNRNNILDVDDDDTLWFLHDDDIVD
ncbi:hypothetical protein VP01_3358g1 [Puccinia sorghi]|uniref:Cell cycle checkpoint protein RAD17 n=1 Tax=Puccinia sorghi TaxID=27349 RepID=A0A0L6UWX9_9BASI|nr:hypothetical protein VP01_3358g1 [Puccinia sorghi]